jgi:hypothetical protein
MLMLLLDLIAALVFRGLEFTAMTVAWLFAGEDGWELIQRYLDDRRQEAAA